MANGARRASSADGGGAVDFRTPFEPSPDVLPALLPDAPRYPMVAATEFRRARETDAVGRLAGGIAHDCNSILSVILTCAQFVRASVDDGDTLAGDVDEIGTANTRAADLTRQLLAFSRLLALDPRVVDRSACGALMEKMLRCVLDADVELTTLLEPALGGVLADEGQFEQIIMHLAVNARDIGMDRPTQARVCEPFFTTKERGKGTGLGLATVFGIVRQSGGHVWLYSEPAHGTTFRIYLRRTDDDAVERAVEPVAPDSDGVVDSDVPILPKPLTPTALRRRVRATLGPAASERGGW